MYERIAPAAGRRLRRATTAAGFPPPLKAVINGAAGDQDGAPPARPLPPHRLEGTTREEVHGLESPCNTPPEYEATLVLRFHRLRHPITRNHPPRHRQLVLLE